MNIGEVLGIASTGKPSRSAVETGWQAECASDSFADAHDKMRQGMALVDLAPDDAAALLVGACRRFAAMPV